MSFLVAVKASNMLKVFVVIGLRFRLVIVISLSSFPTVVILVILLILRLIGVIVCPRLVVVRIPRVIWTLIEV